MEVIKNIIRKCTMSYEANPMKYGYNSVDLVPITNKLNEIKNMIGADKRCL